MAISGGSGEVPPSLRQPSCEEIQVAVDDHARLPVLEYPSNEVGDIGDSSSTDNRYLSCSSATVIRRSSSSGRDRSRRATDPSLPPSVLAPGDIMALVGLVVSTVLTLQAEPTDGWFQAEQHLNHCVPCTGGGETQSCLTACVPYAFLVFEGWCAACFTISSLYIGKFALRRGPSGAFWAVVIYVFGLFPALGWSFYTGVPWQFRGLVGVIYAVTLVVILVIYFVPCLVWRRVRALRSPPADVWQA